MRRFLLSASALLLVACQPPSPNTNEVAASSLCSTPGQYTTGTIRISTAELKLGDLSCTQSGCEGSCCNVCTAQPYVVMCPNDERIVLQASPALNLPVFTGEVDPEHKPVFDFANDLSFRTTLGCVGQYCNLKCSEEISTYGHVEGTLESKSPNGWQLTVSRLD